MSLFHVGGVYSSEIVSALLQMFMLICGVMCLLAAGVCGLDRARRERIAERAD